jgi:oxygen-independent coproporphyrinogen-3 oxidase
VTSLESQNPDTARKPCAYDIPAADLVTKYDRPGPRYTSYPPVTEWTEEFGAEEYAAALTRGNAAGGPLSAYVHLPFCREMCRFCGCNAIATGDRKRMDLYLDVLEREVALVAARLPARRVVAQLHYGGGTPTWLDEAQLERVYAILAYHFRFSGDGEKAIEVDPAVTTPGQLRMLAKMGFNRVSMGVQDFDPAVQHAVARIQTYEETKALMDEARAAGFTSVNLDLMYGLPKQNVDTFKETIDKVLTLSPDRLALFGYAHVPWVKPHQNLLSVADLPAPSQRLALFAAAARTLSAAGYRQIGLDHFARGTDELSRAQEAGHLNRNFQGYNARAALDTVAFGVSAIAEIGGAYAQNAHREKDWRAAIDAGWLATEKGMVVDEDDVLRRFVIDRVMCTFRLDLAEVAERFGAPARERLLSAYAKAKELVSDGIVEIEGDRLWVTDSGRFFLRNVAMLFDGRTKALTEGGGGKPAFSRTV